MKVKKSIQLMAFLQESFPEKSRTNIKSLLSNKSVYVDGKICTAFNFQLIENQIVELKKTIIKPPFNHTKLKLLYEDDFLLVAEKREGLLTISTDKSTTIPTAYNILSNYVKTNDPKSKIFILHRLDRDTSGLLMFTKRKDVQEYMQINWQKIVLERKYVCVVEGVMKQTEGTIKNWLSENKALVVYASTKDNGGQIAITHYKVLNKSEKHTLLEVSLETGRKNQIRVHMQDLGHSVLGDKKYGSTQNPIDRLALHAKVLRFLHPDTDKVLHFETAIPIKFLSLF